jgi:hypothetical protein
MLRSDLGQAGKDLCLQIWDLRHSLNDEHWTIDKLLEKDVAKQRLTREAADEARGLISTSLMVMEMEEVFVARMACFGAIWAKLAKIFVFRSGISGSKAASHSGGSR